MCYRCIARQFGEGSRSAQIKCPKCQGTYRKESKRWECHVLQRIITQEVKYVFRSFSRILDTALNKRQGVLCYESSWVCMGRYTQRRTGA